MKRNCQIMNDEAIAEVIRTQKGLALKDYYVADNGDFITKVWDPAAEAFTARRVYTAGDIAQMVNMPLWEVVGVDSNGWDEYAILFYEEY